MESLKTLLIGCGNAGVLHEFDELRNKPASLIGGMLKYPKYKLIGLCDIKEERAKKAKDKFATQAKIFKEYKKALKELLPEIIIISTWTNSHKDIFINSLKTESVKGIILEKPIAINLQEAEEMYKEWKKRPIPVVVNHVRRWDKKYMYIPNFLKDKVLGELKSVHASVLLGSIPQEWEEEFLKLEGGGTMFHDGTHMIDILLFIFKELKLLKSLVKRGKLIDKSTVAFLLTPQDVPIFLEVGGEREYFHFSLSLNCSKGTYKCGNGILEWSEKEKSKLYKGYNDLIIKETPKDLFKNYHQNLTYSGPFYELLEALENKKNYISQSFQDGYKGIKIMSEILKV